ncbi:hypothetical protein APA_4822 [Pseudanabaena sp. lw0831]|nr:hypothetical protein APA_4822 [Pseudanabaena sp. lw0831]
MSQRMRELYQQHSEGFASLFVFWVKQYRDCYMMDINSLKP